MSYFIDTSALYALFNKKDKNHQNILSIISEIKNNKEKIIYSNYVFDEIVTLLRSKTNIQNSIKIGDFIRRSPTFQRYYLTEEDEKATWDLFIKYDDKEYSYTDCSSFIIMKKLNLEKALTLDYHFEQFGFIKLPK